MPRIARVVATGLPHHLTQRGNNRLRIFFNQADRLAYLDLIQEYGEKYKTSILAYCLMDNHVHFIAIPGEKDSLARTFNVAHMRYAQRIHRKMRSSGHLWQGRFFSCVLDDNHLLAAARYVERNPVRAHCVKDPWDWKWSSAAQHIGNPKSRLPLADLFELIGMNPEKWEELIGDEDAGFVKEIRKNTHTGRPFGNDAFIKDLESRLSRKLTALPVGRPKIGRCP
jgi:putative transposase